MYPKKVRHPFRRRSTILPQPLSIEILYPYFNKYLNTLTKDWHTYKVAFPTNVYTFIRQLAIIGKIIHFNSSFFLYKVKYKATKKSIIENHCIQKRERFSKNSIIRLSVSPLLYISKPPSFQMLCIKLGLCLVGWSKVNIITTNLDKRSELTTSTLCHKFDRNDFNLMVQILTCKIVSRIPVHALRGNEIFNVFVKIIGWQLLFDEHFVDFLYISMLIKPS